MLVVILIVITFVLDFNNGLIMAQGTGKGNLTLPISFNSIYCVMISTRHGDYVPLATEWSNTTVTIVGRQMANYSYSTSHNGDYIIIGI